MLLAWKEIRHSKKKYLLIELILVLLIFMVLFLSGLTNGLGKAVSATISNMPAKSFVLSSDSEDMLALSNIDAEQYESIQKLSDYDTAGFSIFRSTVSRSDDVTKLNVIYFGVKTDKFLNPEIIDGKQLSEGTHEIVLDSSFEENGISIGDVIRDSGTDYEFTVVGFAKDAMYSHAAVGFISSESYEEMRKCSIPGYTLSYNAIAVSGVADIHLDNLEVLSKDEVIQELPGYAAEQMTIQMILWVLLLISAVILGIFFYILTMQKQSQYGVLKAIGMKMTEINTIMMSQILMLSVCGVIIGNLLAFLMASVLPAAMPFFLKLSNALLISCVFVLISLVFGLFSTRYVAKVDPLMVIGGTDHE